MMHSGSTPSRIVDILDMEQGWMNIYALVADLEMRWGQVKLETVRRAIHRLIADNRIKSRLVEVPSMAANTLNTKELEVRA